MREHQIVISLKSEHFQQVQRMARAAGSKSVGLFIRQRLLAALGLDGHDSAAEPERGPDWQRISGQLRRLHRELQVFIAESIAGDLNNLTLEQPLRMPEENFLTDGAPLMPGYNYEYQEAMRNQAAAYPPAAPPPPAPSNKSAASFDSKSDDMEKLADRAFAISPRLGALEQINTRAKELQDPLQDLLGQSLDVAAQSDDDEDDTEEQELDETLAAAPAEDDEETAAADSDQPERYSLTAAQTAGQRQANYEEDPDAADDLTDPNQQSPASDDEPTDIDQRSSATNDEIDTEADERSPTEPRDMGNPPAPPPISGGPPPRKR